ncbi:MAG: hypothetical protein ACOC9Y_04145, partial [Chloroflexota bacterium]
MQIQRTGDRLSHRMQIGIAALVVVAASILAIALYDVLNDGSSTETRTTTTGSQAVQEGDSSGAVGAQLSERSIGTDAANLPELTLDRDLAREGIASAQSDTGASLTGTNAVSNAGLTVGNVAGDPDLELALASLPVDPAVNAVSNAGIIVGNVAGDPDLNA